MMNKNNQEFINLIRNLRVGNFRVLVSGKFSYTTNNLFLIDEDHIKFTDLKGDKVVCKISDITSIVEVSSR